METDDLDPAPRGGMEVPVGPRVQALADSLDCLLQPDLAALAGIKYSTTEAWAKRGDGPPFVMLGNRRLYPREGVRKFLAERMRERSGVSTRSLL
jgi:hypothetical protein